jgi:hypothetical protein
MPWLGTVFLNSPSLPFCMFLIKYLSLYFWIAYFTNLLLCRGTVVSLTKCLGEKASRFYCPEFIIKCQSHGTCILPFSHLCPCPSSTGLHHLNFFWKQLTIWCIYYDVNSSKSSLFRIVSLFFEGF